MGSKITEKLDEAIAKWLKANAGYSETVWEPENIDIATDCTIDRMSK